MKIFRTASRIVNFWLDVALITAVLAGFCFIFFWPVRVAGSSMSPALNMSDQVIASRFAGFVGNFSEGDLVMARVEIDGETEIVIKRIADILDDGRYFLLGDNAAISIDSRHFGPVTNRQIVARILLRYFPLSVIEIF